MKIKSKYFIIFGILLILITSAIVFIPKENWRKIFSTNKTAATFTATFKGTWENPGMGDWDNPGSWTDASISLNGVQGIVISSTTNDIYVTDTNNNRIVVLNPDGTASTTYDNLDASYSPKGFNGPGGIALSPNGYIYILDTYNNRIVVLNPNGTASTTYNNLDASYSPKGLHYPNDITLSPNGYIYVSDTYNNRIVVLNPDGTASTTYNNLDASYSPNGFNESRGIVLSPNGNIYVVDRGNNRIVVLNPNGTASTTYNNLGFDGPRGIALSPNGYIYVVNMGSSRVNILNPNGTASTTYDAKPLGFGSPYGIVVSSDGHMYITNSGSGQVTTLDASGNTEHIYGSSFSLGEVYPGASDDVEINWGTIVLTKDESVHDLTIDATSPESTLDLNGFTLNVIGSFTNNGTLIENGGTINLLGCEDLTVDSLTTLDENTCVNNLNLVPDGTLDLNSYTIYVKGDWNNTGGTLINNGGTVNMIATSTQSILGKNTFENLTKIVNSFSSLFFDSSTTTTITGKLILKGTSEYGQLAIGSATNVYQNSSKMDQIISNTGGTTLTIDSSDKIYTTNYSNHSIDILNSNGTLSASYILNKGMFFDGGTNVISPYAVAINPLTNEIYFANYNDSYIYVLNPNGTASTTYDIRSSVDNGNAILGLAVSSSGYMYIEGQDSHLYIFNPDGIFETSVSVSMSPNDYGINPILISQSGEIYITGNNIITILNPNGTASSTPTITIPVAGTFYGGIAISESGNIYIGQTNGDTHGNTFFDSKNKILILNPSGSVISSSPVAGSISSLALNSSGEIYVLRSVESTRILSLFNSDGSLSQTFEDVTKGKISMPIGIVHDNLGNIYISDMVLNNIQKFSSSGSYLNTFDTSGSGELDIYMTYFPFEYWNFNPIPSGGTGQLAIDSSNNIYIASGGNNKIIKFNSDGVYQDSVSIEQPLGVAVDNDGYIYVSSGSHTSNNNKIIKLNPDFSVNTETSEPFGTNINMFPVELKIDPTNTYLYVVEIYYNDIVKLNLSDLSFFSKSQGPAELPFTIPVSLDFDSTGNIYVSEEYGDIVKLSPDFSFISNFGQNILSWADQIMVDSEDNIWLTGQDSGGMGKVEKFTPALFSPFQILHTNPTANNIELSYLDVSGSNNISSSPFICTTGCTNEGSNSNWIFSSAGGRRGSSGTPTIYTTLGSTPQNILSSISISPLNLILSTTTASNFISTTLDQFGNPIAETINWTSSNTSIGTINSTGLFTALRAGTTTVTATAGTLSTSTSVTVHQVLTSISIAPLNPNVIYKATQQFTSSPLDQFGYPFATTTKWTSSNTTIGTINASGLFTASKNKGGTTVITAKAGTFSATTTVNVARAFALSGAALADIAPVQEPTAVVTPATGGTIIEPQEATNTIVMVSTTTEATTSQNNLVSNITDSIVAGYQNSIITVADIQNVKDVVNSDIGSAVTKTISTAGIVAGASASIGAIAFATPVTFAELWLLPAKLFGLLMGALGIRRKNKQWGTVYDSVTKRPLDPVYVSLISVDTGKEVAGAITDIDGRYGFLVLPGKYKIEAKKTNYIQPSVKMSGKSFDEVYNDLYFGNEITIEKEGEMITKNIPMDSLSFDWNEFAKTKMNVNNFMKGKDITWAKISGIIFFIGAIVSFIAVIAAPAPYNLIVAIFYVLAYILNFFVFKSKKVGTLIEKKTGMPLSFAIVSIFREGETSSLTKKIADKFGDYYALVPKGKYSIKVEKKKDDGTYTEVFKTEDIEIKTGVINMNFVV